MTDQPTRPNGKARLRRPTPERTRPNRGILGVFDQRDWSGPDPNGHPLGFDVPEEPAELRTDDTFLDTAVREASDLVDRHIREGEAEAQTEAGGVWSRLSTMAAGAEAADMQGIAETVTRAYREVATAWIDLAREVAGQIAVARSAPQQSAAPGQTAAANSPALSIRAACAVEARVEMFGAGPATKTLPLASDNPAQTDRITDVSIDGGRLRIVVPADHPPGTYHGLLQDDAGAPAGVVTVEVLPDDGGGS